MQLCDFGWLVGFIEKCVNQYISPILLALLAKPYAVRLMMSARAFLS